MKRLILAIFITSSLSNFLIADEDGGVASPFQFGVGARELALGAAAISDADPAVAVHWNAAALARAQQISFTGFHSRLLGDGVTYQYFGAALPTLDFGAIGIGVARLGVTGIERRDGGNLLSGEFDDSRLAIEIGYARQIANYDVGLAFSIERHQIDSYRSTSSPGLSLAIGRSFATGLSWLHDVSATAVGHNLVASTSRLGAETESYSTSGDLALSSAIQPISTADLIFAIHGRASRLESRTTELAAGVETRIGNVLMLRSGIRDGDLSLGAGINARFLRFNYAVVERDLGFVHTFDVTINVGASLDRRRDNRDRAREERFRSRMSDYMTTSNRELIVALMRDGGAAADSGNFAQATASFDRALFLARASALDTIDIQQRLAQTEARFEQQQQELAFQRRVESAAQSLSDSDFVAARYAATRALELRPDDPRAQLIVQTANDALAGEALREQVITDKLARADSLLILENIDRALSEVRGLAAVAGGDARVAKALQRVEFAHWRERAAREHAAGNRARAAAALDSAESRFPGHPWCAEMKRLLRQSNSAPTATVAAAGPRPSTQLQEAALRDAAAAYDAGKRSFDKGELDQAILQWERAESLAPDYQSVRDHLVKAYKFVGVELYGKGRLEDAAAIWRKALRLSPENAEISGYMRRVESEITRLQELGYGPE